MSDKAIICHSAGSAGVIGTRKAKKAPHVVDMIVKKLQFSLIKFKIKCIIIFVRRKAVKAMNYLIRSLARFGIKIISFHLRRVQAHNGVRGRKMKRK